MDQKKVYKEGAMFIGYCCFPEETLVRPMFSFREHKILLFTLEIAVGV